ncbi:hypothetical protein D3C87_2040980 [compost metagenome]
MRWGPACQNSSRRRSSVSGAIITRWIDSAASEVIISKNAMPIPSNWSRRGPSTSATNSASGSISMHLDCTASENRVSLSPKWL